MTSPEERVKQAFPDSEWEWWYITTPNGTISYHAIVFTTSRTILGIGMNHSLTRAADKAYRKAAKHPHVAGWHQRMEAPCKSKQ